MVQKVVEFIFNDGFTLQLGRVNKYNVKVSFQWLERSLNSLLIIILTLM